jgi:hypothetical protein
MLCAKDEQSRSGQRAEPRESIEQFKTIDEYSGVVADQPASSRSLCDGEDHKAESKVDNPRKHKNNSSTKATSLIDSPVATDDHKHSHDRRCCVGSKHKMYCWLPTMCACTAAVIASRVTVTTLLVAFTWFTVVMMIYVVWVRYQKRKNPSRREIYLIVESTLRSVHVASSSSCISQLVYISPHSIYNIAERILAENVEAVYWQSIQNDAKSPEAASCQSTPVAALYGGDDNSEEPELSIQSTEIILLDQNEATSDALSCADVSSLIDLLDQLEITNHSAFCFYRCVMPNDRKSFVSHWIPFLTSLAQEEEGEKHYVSTLANLCKGGMELTMWMKVMKACQDSGHLSNNYVIYERNHAGLTIIRQFATAEESKGHTVKILLSTNHLQLISDGDCTEMVPNDTTRLSAARKKVICTRQAGKGPRNLLINVVKTGMLVFGNSIPSQEEHTALVREFQGSAVVGRFKNFDSKNNPVLDTTVLKDIFTTLKTQLPSRFSYYHCLHPDDQRVFEEHLMLAFQEEAAKPNTPVEAVLARVASGGIDMTMWQSVMSKCATIGLFVHHYVLYRRAYWGENSNEFSDNTIYSFYHCVVTKFEVPDESSYELIGAGGTETRPGARVRGTIAVLFDGYGHLNQLSTWFLNPSRHMDPNRHLPTDLVIY